MGGGAITNLWYVRPHHYVGSSNRTMARHSTIRDVARLAGVSIATVSRTLSRPGIVADETREAVLQAVMATGYKPNSLAVGLRRLEARSVVVLVSDISNPFYSDVFKGAEEAARAHGYSVLIGDLSTDPDNGATYVDMVRARRADGIVMMSADLPSNIQDGFDFPLVYASSYDPDGRLPSVSIDYVAAARSATEHLVSLGHRRIAHLSGALGSPSCRDKLAGYRQALHAADLMVVPDLEYEGDDTIDSGAAGIVQLIAGDRPPTAVFAANDEMAIGAIRALAARGLAVPTDFSVVGFDDIKFAAAYAPAITTVRVPRFEIGRRAMELIIGLLAAETLPSKLLQLPTQLIIRDSAAPFRTN